MKRADRPVGLTDQPPEEGTLTVQEQVSTLTRIGAMSGTNPSRQALQPGERFGPYLLVRQLGAGGMAEVWLAQRADGTFKREVALKVPLSGLHENLAKRF